LAEFSGRESTIQEGEFAGSASPSGHGELFPRELAARAWDAGRLLSGSHPGGSTSVGSGPGFRRGFRETLILTFFPLEVSVKKRLTFKFLPWVAAAGVCVGGSFVRGEDAVVPAVDSSVLAGELAPEPADIVEGEIVAGEAAAAGPCMKTVKVWKMVPEIREVEATEWTTEVRERTFTVKTKVPRIEEKTRSYTVMVPEKRTKTVEYTVNVNVPETKTVEYTVNVPYTEQLEKSYTVMVPVKEERTATYKVNVPYTEERTATYKVNVPYTEQVEQTYTVRVPYTEEMTGYRTVSKRVPVKSTKTVTCRGGQWITEAKEISANGKYDAEGNPCCPKVVCCRKWVPTCETKEIEVTTWKTECEQVPFTYCVKKFRCEERSRMVCVQKSRCEERTRTYCVKLHRCEERTRNYCVTKMVPETRTKTVCVNKSRCETRTREITVNKCVPETRTREVCYTVMVPVQKTQTYSVCCSDIVEEQKSESYTVRVPKTVTKKVCVQVKKCVEEEVPAGDAGACGNGGNGGRGCGKGGLLHCRKGC
jgi:hypothetical protein